MKFSIIIAIVFGLLSMTLMLIEANSTVWIHNKVTRGTWTHVSAAETKDGDSFDEDGDWAHHGYSVSIPNSVNSYWLKFSVTLSGEDNKWRGPILNNGDRCFHLHGTIDTWKVFDC
ncbi:13790_t:CDS:2 [Funneliformis mosseae]|uniref:13790_t:CDS:1 n=1 Tax=Funneliformis mosseae TaxID=27381 RepID=A0A9N9I0Z5_FUNMO|nr:13790_t:CDS:2 [Funneliformis mosseae]